MPKQVVHYGKQYKLVTHKATNSTSEWREAHDWNGEYLEDDKGNLLPLPPDTQAAQYPSVELVWTRPSERTPLTDSGDPEGFVQLGMIMDMVDLKNTLRHGDLDDPNLRSKTFYTRALTRHQINEMIRTLKRARDAAFGADE